ncbi:MAG: type II/IV secretion system ATPase subunit [Nitrososphaerota archaeon]|nr:type II/IV secretion system ATPase subunit [Nitrososphaerota archaeon]MDG6938876.1 type II/IV secretion system ATPase subunit [Nitrososphaerota archaeon]
MRQPKDGRAAYAIVRLPDEPPAGAEPLEEYVVHYPIGPMEPVPLRVSLYACEGAGHYLVREPELMPGTKAVVEEAIATSPSWLASSDVIEVDPVGYMMANLKRNRRLLGVGEDEIRTVAYYLHRDILGYGPLDPYLKDPYLEDVSCEGPGRRIRLWHARHNRQEWLEGGLFLNSASLDSLVMKLANRAGSFVSSAQPVTDATLPEGHRVTCTWKGEVSSFGSSFSIRKFRASPYSIVELIKSGTVSAEVAAYLWALLELKGFVMIVGTSASGKTTLLNSLAAVLHPNWKVISIEDVREINLPMQGWKALHTRPGSSSGLGRVDLFDLVKLSLRERPDFVILGEARGSETFTLFQSALTGHGSLTTFHATDEDSLVGRLTQPPVGIPQGMLSAIDAVVFVRRVQGSSLRVVQRVSEYHAAGWRTIFRRGEGAYAGSWEHSTALQRRAEGNGLSPGALRASMERRVAFLSRQVGLGPADGKELAKVLLARYYAPVDS